MPLDHLKKKPAPKPAPDTAPPPADAHPLTKALDAIAGLPAPKKPKAEKPSVTRACGHKQGLADLEGSACAGCQTKRRWEKKAARWAKRDGKRDAERAACQARADDRGRLPDGAEFHVAYSAADRVWKGRLLVVDCNNVCKDFTGEHSGVFKLLTALDAQYRAWAAPQAQASD